MRGGFPPITTVITSAPMTKPVTGSCQCGGVTFELAQDPYFTVICHCTECQKLSSSAFSFSQLVNREDFEVKGELARYDRPTTTGAVARCFFCPTCGNRIYHDAGPDEPMIRLKGSLDDKERIRPRVQMWGRSRQPWLGRVLGNLSALPVLATQTFDRPTMIRHIVIGKVKAVAALAFRVLGWVCIALVGWHLLAG